MKKITYTWTILLSLHMFLWTWDRSPFHCTLHPSGHCCPVQRGGWGVEWGHCYPCAPYHTVLNSRTWVTHKLSFRQPIANCRVREQGCVTMDTYVYLCGRPKYPTPKISNRDVSWWGTVFERAAKKDYWWYWLNVPQSLQPYSKFPVLGQKGIGNSSGAPAVFKLLSFYFQWQPLSLTSL